MLKSFLIFFGIFLLYKNECVYLDSKDLLQCEDGEFSKLIVATNPEYWNNCSHNKGDVIDSNHVDEDICFIVN